MKRKLLTLAIAAVAALTATAQDIFDNPNNRPYFGVRASYELACPTNISYAGNKIESTSLGNGSGFNLGVIYNLPMWKNLYFEPGVSLYYNTWSINKGFALDVLEHEHEILVDKVNSASVRRWGLRIPLHIGYHFDFTPDIKVSVFTGPELELSLSGSVNYGVKHASVTGDAFGDEGNFNRPDFKWRFGVGATFMDHYYVAVSGAVGICDMVKKYPYIYEGNYTKREAEMRSNVFDLTIGYNF